MYLVMVYGGVASIPIQRHTCPQIGGGITAVAHLLQWA